MARNRFLYIAALLILSLTSASARSLYFFHQIKEGKMVGNQIVRNDSYAPVIVMLRSFWKENISIFHVPPHQNVFGITFICLRASVLQGKRFCVFGSSASICDRLSIGQLIRRNGGRAISFGYLIAEIRWDKSPEIEPSAPLTRVCVSCICPFRADYPTAYLISGVSQGAVSLDGVDSGSFPSHLGAALGDSCKPLFSRFFKLSAHNLQLPLASAILQSTDCNYASREDSDYDGRMGEPPAKRILGGFIFLLGVAFAYAAYAATDHPNPSWGWCWCGIIGWGILFALVGYGTLLAIGP